MGKPSKTLWEEVSSVFNAIIKHPFIEELSKGTLDEGVFKYYVIQDALYLDEYSRVLATLAGKAPREEWVKVFAEDSIAILEFEKALHNEYFRAWNLTPNTYQHGVRKPSMEDGATERVLRRRSSGNPLLLDISRGRALPRERGVAAPTLQ
jgi:thiaminase